MKIFRLPPLHCRHMRDDLDQRVPRADVAQMLALPAPAPRDGIEEIEARAYLKPYTKSLFQACAG